MTISVDVRRATPTPPPRKYPWLGTDGSRIVLFSGPGVGTVLKNSTGIDIGRNYGTWIMTPFTEVPSDEEVVIRQVH